MSEESFSSELSSAEKRLHQSALVSCYGSESGDESTSSDDEKSVYNTPPGSLGSVNERRSENNSLRLGKELISKGKSCQGLGWTKDSVNRLREVPRTYCPHWVYRMYDSYCLAQRVAGILTLHSFSPFDVLFVSIIFIFKIVSTLGDRGYECRFSPI